MTVIENWFQQSQGVCNENKSKSAVNVMVLLYHNMYE